MDALTLVAVTHHHAPFSILERVTLDPDAADAVASDLRALPGVDEAVVLSTCNRTELYLAADRRRTGAVLDVLASHTGVTRVELTRSAVLLSDDDASLHLFRVAAGLESRVIGEGEILGQVRAAAARAARSGMSGPRLTGLFRWAAATGRRARRDAGGPARPSVARTALDAVPTAPGATLVIGAGAMAAAVTAELRVRRAPFRVAARRVDRAARLTCRPSDAVDLDALADEMARADVVVCTTSARTAIVGRDAVADALTRRHGGRLAIVDLSMPRNVAPDVGALPGVDLVHLHDLRGGHGDLSLRRASDAVTAEHDRYRLWLAGRAVGPIIAALRRQVAAACLAEAEHHLDGAEAAVFAHRLAGRVLHAPTLAVKELSARGETAALDALAAALGVDVPVQLAEAS